MEEITLNLGEPKLNVIEKNDPGTIKIHVDSPTVPTGQKSANFGPGAEMLMNPNKQKTSGSPKTDINLTDLDELNTIGLGSPPKKPSHGRISR